MDIVDGNMRKLTLLFVFSIVLAACGENNENVFDAPVRSLKAEESFTLSGSPMELCGEKPDVISDLFVYDSTLLLKGTVKDSPFMIHAYSLDDKSFKGSYIAKGRGENELLSPHFEGLVQEGIYIFDLNLCSSYCFDYVKSSETHNSELSRLVKLPGNTLYAYPMGDKHLALVPEPEDFVGKIVDRNGAILNTVSLYPHVSGIDYFSRLSSASLLGQSHKKFAMAMCRLPQVNFLDLETGDKFTIVISKEYKDWLNMLNGSDEDLRYYYLSCTQSSKYFMALYFGGATRQERREGVLPHLHVFDWNGGFLYDIALNESIESIAFDEMDNKLYGVDSNDNVYRYDMSELL